MMHAPFSHSGISAVRLLLDALLETGALSAEEFKGVVQHMQAGARDAIERGVASEDFRSIARILAVFDDEGGS